MSEALNFFLTFKDHFMWTIVTTFDGRRITPRVCGIRYHEKLGIFLFTKSISRKIDQMKRNPYSTLSIRPPDGFSNIVAQCTVRVSEDPSEIDLVYSDNLKNYGFSGRDDTRIRLCIFTIHKVVVGSKTYEGTPLDTLSVKLDQSLIEKLEISKFETDEALKIVNGAITQDSNWHLITRSNMFHDDRIVCLTNNPKHGLLTATARGSRKINQINADANVCLLLEQHESASQIVIDAVARAIYSPDINTEIWHEPLKKFGFSGPDDAKLWILAFSIRSVTVHRISELHPQVYYCELPQLDKDEILLLSVKNCSHMLSDHCRRKYSPYTTDVENKVFASVWVLHDNSKYREGSPDQRKPTCNYRPI